jgi:hypothetical protein
VEWAITKQERIQRNKTFEYKTYSDTLKKIGIIEHRIGNVKVQVKELFQNVDKTERRGERKKGRKGGLRDRYIEVQSRKSITYPMNRMRKQ